MKKEGRKATRKEVEKDARERMERVANRERFLKEIALKAQTAEENNQSPRKWHFPEPDRYFMANLIVEDLKDDPEMAKAIVYALIDYYQGRLIDGGTAKRGKVGTIRKLIEKLNPETVEDLLSKLEEDDVLDDLRFAARDPLHFELLEIDRDKSQLRYRTSSRYKRVSFKRLKNLLYSKK